MVLLLLFQGANQPPPPPMKPSELYYSKITPALKEKVRKGPWFVAFYFGVLSTALDRGAFNGLSLN